MLNAMLSLYNEYKKLHTLSHDAPVDNDDMLSCSSATIQVMVLRTGKFVWTAEELLLLYSCGGPDCDKLRNTIACLCAFIDVLNGNTVGRDFVQTLIF